MYVHATNQTLPSWLNLFCLISFELCRENSRISKTYTHIIASTKTLEWNGL